MMYLRFFFFFWNIFKFDKLFKIINLMMFLKGLVLVCIENIFKIYVFFVVRVVESFV